jgi:hypothetical protein
MSAFVDELAAIRERRVLRETTYCEAINAVMAAFAARNLTVTDEAIADIVDSNSDLHQRYGSIT